MDREQLIEAYAKQIIDGIDHKDLYTMMYNTFWRRRYSIHSCNLLHGNSAAYETLTERLKDYTQADLENEIAEFAPHLLQEA